MTIEFNRAGTGSLTYGPLRQTGDAPAGGIRRLNPGASPTGGVATAEQLADASSATAPAGVDPELWTVLTTEERNFFAKVNLAAPLTYGPRASQQPVQVARLGGRLDVRV